MKVGKVIGALLLLFVSACDGYEPSATGTNRNSYITNPQIEEEQ